MSLVTIRRGIGPTNAKEEPFVQPAMYGEVATRALYRYTLDVSEAIAPEQLMEFDVSRG
ncbi:MAG: hypothetical protein KGQ46_14310 [Hyphomicrobiales bacterium]|nr:hypothetical protein [Hyphomicrobiales bacterium]MDE2115943.1 hypothetical protein [Hyphomicrobiales bacterium]